MEDLNQHKNAYEKQFRFYFENHLYLGKYAELMCKSIQVNNLKSVISLGIGHEVVSGKLLNLLETGQISRYQIVEGSDEIIQKFIDERPHLKSNERFEVSQSYFEDFVPREKFDAIEMGFVLEHVDDPLLVLNRFKSFLNPGATVFISVPNARSLHRLIGHEAGMLEDMYQLSQYDYELGHKRYFDIESLKSMVHEAGLKVDNCSGLMLKPITGDQMDQLSWGQSIYEALLTIGVKYPEISNCLYIEASIE